MGTNWMIFAALFGSSVFYVQAFRILRTQNVAGLSEIAYSISFVSALAWLSYAFMTNNPVIKVSGTANLIGASLVLFLIFRYRAMQTLPTVRREDIKTEEQYLKWFKETNNHFHFIGLSKHFIPEICSGDKEPEEIQEIA